MRIDLHHHFFPSTIDKAKLNADIGWITPPSHMPWSPEVSLGLMDEAHVDLAILSLPAVTFGSVSDENRKLARERNDFLASVRDQYPKRFGFFATVPFLDDVDGTLMYLVLSLNRNSGILS
jgi:6-methylsalicylate decarboxylase